VTAPVLDRYRDAPAADRFHVWVRWHSCPIPDVAVAVPTTGLVLDVGCGHGLVANYLADTAPDRTVVGIDIDPHKVAAARGSLRPGDATTFEVTAPGVLPDGPFDAVVIVDVLYLLDDAGRDRLLADAVARLAPDGVLVVKEVTDTPPLKARLAAVQERLSTGVLGITAGTHRGFDPPGVLAGRLRSAGCDEVEVRPLDRGRLHPHLLVVGRRPVFPSA
jgi:SAM-dependent methyltransferase